MNNSKGLAEESHSIITEKFSHFIASYTDRGYITGTTDTICSPYLDYLFKTHTAIFKFPKFDHQTLSYNCDPNFINRDLSFDWLKG